MCMYVHGWTDTYVNIYEMHIHTKAEEDIRYCSIIFCRIPMKQNLSLKLTRVTSIKPQGSSFICPCHIHGVKTVHGHSQLFNRF